MSSSDGSQSSVGESRVLAVLGAGGHAHVVADAALESRRFDTIEFYDDDPSVAPEWCGHPLRGTIRGLLDDGGEGLSGKRCIIAVGSNAGRSRLTREWLALGGVLVSVIHPAAVVARAVDLGAGSVVIAGAIVKVDTAIGRSCIINSNTCIGHDCALGECVHVGPGAALGGYVTVGDRSWIGIGAVVREGVTIGSDATVGAGAAVLNDVPDGAVVVGVPARPLARKGGTGKGGSESGGADR